MQDGDELGGRGSASGKVAGTVNFDNAIWVGMRAMADANCRRSRSMLAGIVTRQRVDTSEITSTLIAPPYCCLIDIFAMQVYYINLEKRKDRNDEFLEEELRKRGLLPD